MVASDAAKLETVPLRVTDKQFIPAARYYDPEFFELERKRLWPHVWQMACRLEEIAELGDYTEYRILDKSVLIVHTKNGIKAFHNACRHRGMQLAAGHGNCKTKGFICPFHGWRWNAEGENTFVFGKTLFSEEVLARAEIDLVPCRLELWGGYAFINFDNNAPGLLESLGPVAEKMMDRRVDALRTDWWYATTLPCNWKLAMEAFMEGYHVMRTHPQLNTYYVAELNPYGTDAGIAPTSIQTTVREFVEKTIMFAATNSEGMAGMTLPSEIAIARQIEDMELPESLPDAAAVFYHRWKDAIYQDGLARGLPVFDMNAADAKNGFTFVEFMFPHFFLLPYFSAMASYRIRPLTPETCTFEIWSLIPMAADDPRPRVKEPTFLRYDSPDYPEIPRQDYSNLPMQQLGLHAEGFTHMRLSQVKEGLISNYQRLIDGYIAGLAPEKLAQAAQIVNNGFDSPILDIGF